MPCELNRDAKIKLWQEDLAWLMEQPRTLERDHIAQILEHDIREFQSATTALAAADKLAEGLSDLEKKWRHEGTDIRAPFMDKVTAANALVELLAAYRQQRGGA